MRKYTSDELAKCANCGTPNDAYGTRIATQDGYPVLGECCMGHKGEDDHAGWGDAPEHGYDW